MSQLAYAAIGAAIAFFILAPIIACLLSSIITERDSGEKP